jgi:hypothetical protein
MTAAAPMRFSWVKFARSLAGLIVAPLAGGVISVTVYALSAFGWQTDYYNPLDTFLGALSIGFQGGATFGIAPALVVGWPLHLFLLGVGFTNLPSYLTFGAAVAVIGFRVIMEIQFGPIPSYSPIPFELTLLVAAAGAIGASIFWFIRRPDHDMPSEAATPPPPAQ